jgi:hypothetical protein
MIDDIDIEKIGLTDLRSRLSESAMRVCRTDDLSLFPFHVAIIPRKSLLEADGICT